MTVLRYPNAYRGVKKIFIALLISLGLSVLTYLPYLILAALGRAYGVLYSSGYRIFSYVNMVLSFGYLALMLVGALQAGRDEPLFKAAVIPLIGRIALLLIQDILGYLLPDLIPDPAMTWVFEISSVLLFVCYLWGLLSIVDGGIALAERYEARGLIRFGKLLIWLIPISCIPQLIARCLDLLQLAGLDPLQTIYDQISYEQLMTWRQLLQICSMVLSMAILVLLSVFLARALKLLRTQAPESEPETEIAP